MAHVNVEIKARCGDEDRVRGTLHAHGAVFKGLDRQTDVYFNVSRGRLKLRRGRIENALIFYKRPDQEGPRQSNVHLCPCSPDGGDVEALFAEMLGVRVNVVKDREIYFIGNVKFHIDNFRVEQKTDYEKLLIEVETDGSIHPKDALKEAAKILIHHFMLFSDEKISVDTEEKSVSEEFDESSLHIRQLLKTKLVDLDLSVRALNCLKAADVESLGELVAFNKNDLLKFRNFGKKSLTELEELVKSKGLEFGMNISKYKLDKE